MHCVRGHGGGTRGEEPPDDTVVIIRAGVMASESVRRTARDAFEDFGLYLVSVEAVLEGTIETTAPLRSEAARYRAVPPGRAVGPGPPGTGT